MDLSAFQIPTPPPPTAADTARCTDELRTAAARDGRVWTSRPAASGAAPADADPRPFSLRSPGCVVTGTLAHGVADIVIAPHRIAADIRVAAAACTGAQLTPLGARRSLRAGDARVSETIHAPAGADLGWIEWSVAEAARLRVEWRVPAAEYVTAPAAGQAAAPRAVAPVSAPAAADGDDAAASATDALGFAWHPCHSRDIAWCAAAPAAALTVQPVDGELRCAATVGLPDGGSFRLTFGLTRDGGRTPTELDPAVHRRGRAARHRRAERERLRVRSPDPALDAALRRAVLDAGDLPIAVGAAGRLATASLDARTGEPRIDCRTAALLALAALFAGDTEAAEHSLHTLRTLQAPDGAIPRAVTLRGVPLAGDVDATALFVILAARRFAADGAHAHAAADWPAVAAALESLRGAHAGPLVHAARADAALLAEAIRAPGTAAAGAAPLVAIPTAAPPLDPIAAVLAAVTTEAERCSAAAGGRDATADTDAVAGALGDAARLISFTAATLGFEPDAGRHRLRLAPAFPPDWDACAVDGIRVGDALLRFDFARLGDEYRLAIEQETGTVPLRLVLEPRVAAQKLASATLDGAHAELDPRSLDGTLIVPVQFGLEQPRVFAFRVRTGRHA